MTTLTVKISDKKHARMLFEMLNSMKFVKQVEMNEGYNFEEDEIKILEERFTDYQRNPKSGSPLEDVVTKISRKHGFKNNR
jgi:hypothetical protein